MIKAILIRLGVMLSLLSIGFVSTSFIGSAYAASDVSLKNGHPQEYFVQEGDTLWGIASMYLESPWQWPEIWFRNEDVVDNPHLIYPGDVLQVVYVGGRPQIIVKNDGAPQTDAQSATAQTENPEATAQTSGIVKLTPQIRVKPIGTSIPAIPLEAIQAYLSDTRIVTRKELKAAPHIVSAEDGRIIAGAGDVIYARDRANEWETLFANYGIYRGGEEYIDPDTGESLGFEALAIGNGKVLGTRKEVATLRISDSKEDVRINDKLVPTEERRVDAVFYPKGPSKDIEGTIIRVFNSISYIGQHDVVVINKGGREGLEAGHVLSVMQKGELIKDRVNEEFVEMPPTNAGLIILFRVFDKASFGLVLKARKPMRLGDYVTNPQYGY